VSGLGTVHDAVQTERWAERMRLLTHRTLSFMSMSLFMTCSYLLSLQQERASADGLFRTVAPLCDLLHEHTNAASIQYTPRPRTPRSEEMCRLSGVMNVILADRTKAELRFDGTSAAGLTQELADRHMLFLFTGFHQYIRWRNGLMDNFHHLQPCYIDRGFGRQLCRLLPLADPELLASTPRGGGEFAICNRNAVSDDPYELIRPAVGDAREMIGATFLWVVAYALEGEVCCVNPRNILDIVFQSDDVVDETTFANLMDNLAAATNYAASPHSYRPPCPVNLWLGCMLWSMHALQPLMLPSNYDDPLPNVLFKLYMGPRVGQLFRDSARHETSVNGHHELLMRLKDQHAPPTKFVECSNCSGGCVRKDAGNCILSLAFRKALGCVHTADIRAFLIDGTVRGKHGCLEELCDQMPWYYKRPCVRDAALRDELQEVCEALLPAWRLVETAPLGDQPMSSLKPLFCWPDVARLTHALELCGLPRELVCEIVLSLYLSAHMANLRLEYICS
jgi:hypothetical protein